MWCGVLCAVLQVNAGLLWKAPNLYTYIHLIPRLWIYINIYLWSQDCGSGHLWFQNSLLWLVLLLVLINTAMPLIPRLWICINTFDPKTVDLYKNFRSQDCGSFKLELSSEYGVVSCFLVVIVKTDLIWNHARKGVNEFTLQFAAQLSLDPEEGTTSWVSCYIIELDGRITRFTDTWRLYRGAWCTL